MKPKYLTLEEIEQCANNIVQKVYPKSTIKDKHRFLKEPLLCRYAYYKIARSFIDKNGDHIHKMEQVAGHVGFNHATMVNARKAMEALIHSRNEKAISLFYSVEQECNKRLKEKYENLELNKECKYLLIGLYAA